MTIGDGLNYNQLDGKLKFQTNFKEKEIQVFNLRQAIINTTHELIFVITNTDNVEELHIYNMSGEKIFTSKAPQDFTFWYLSSSDLKVACNGMTSATEDKFGRSSWWFKIDLKNGAFTKDTLAY